VAFVGNGSGRVVGTVGTVGTSDDVGSGDNVGSGASRVVGVVDDGAVVRV
jgi:hypothetical protein